MYSNVLANLQDGVVDFFLLPLSCSFTASASSSTFNACKACVKSAIVHAKLFTANFYYAHYIFYRLIHSYVYSFVVGKIHCLKGLSWWKQKGNSWKDWKYLNQVVICTTDVRSACTLCFGYFASYNVVWGDDGIKFYESLVPHSLAASRRV